MKAYGFFWFIGLAAASNVWGQGQITFANRASNPSVDAPVFDSDCKTPLEGPGFLWQVYAGPSSQALQPLRESSPFRSGLAAGYIVGGIYEIPGVLPGHTAYTQLRAWEAASGGTYEAAVATNGKHGFSNIVPITASGGTPHPPYPVGLESFCLTDGSAPNLGGILRTETNLVITFNPGPNQSDVLQAASSVLGPWLTVTNATAPYYTILAPSAEIQLFRLIDTNAAQTGPRESITVVGMKSSREDVERQRQMSHTLSAISSQSVLHLAPSVSVRHSRSSRFL